MVKVLPHDIGFGWGIIVEKILIFLTIKSPCSLVDEGEKVILQRAYTAPGNEGLLLAVVTIKNPPVLKAGHESERVLKS